MPQYVCPRCGYNCNQKNDLRKHFNRKKICYPVLEDIEITECYKRTLGEEFNESNKNFLKCDKIKNCASEMHPKCIRHASGINKKKINNNGIIENKQIITCEYCNKTFTKHQNYYRHKKVDVKERII